MFVLCIVCVYKLLYKICSNYFVNYRSAVLVMGGTHVYSILFSHMNFIIVAHALGAAISAE